MHVQPTSKFCQLSLQKYIPRAGFLNLDAIDILSQIILGCGGLLCSL